MSNQVGDCFKFLWPFQNFQTLPKLGFGLTLPAWSELNYHWLTYTGDQNDPKSNNRIIKIILSFKPFIPLHLQWPRSKLSQFRIMPYSEIVVRDQNPQFDKNNGHIWATQWPTSSGLKIKFDPSIERSWCEHFKIIKGHVPQECSWVLGCSFKKWDWGKCSVHFLRGPWIDL